MAMRYLIGVLCVSAIVSLASAGETLFTKGPQEFGGRNYYWLAEWKLEVTLPDDVAPGDRFEVFYGTKGPTKRPLHYECDGKSGTLAEVRPQAFEWIELPLAELASGKQVVLSGKGSGAIAFLAGVRITGKSTAELKVKATRIAQLSSPGNQSAAWAKLPGFEATDETRSLWEPSPAEPDWRRAERSSQYAGTALSKVQRWLHEHCLPIRDEPSGLFRPTGREWNYRDTAADCYPFYIWAAFYTDKAVLDTVMIDVLEAEQRLCNHLDSLPVRYGEEKGSGVNGTVEPKVFGSPRFTTMEERK